MRFPILHILAAFLLLLLFAADGPALDVPYEYPEPQVEAAFLFNFAKFVNWPENSFENDTSPLVLSVFDSNMFEVVRRTLAGKTVKGRRLEVRFAVGVEQTLSSHIVFIGRSGAFALGKILPALVGRPVLTISDIPGFVDKGGTIEMFREGRKIRFGVGLDVARRSGLEISSEVLRLASFIRNVNGGRS